MVTVVMEEDLNQTVLKVVLVKAVVKVEEMNRVADTMEEIAMVKVAQGGGGGSGGAAKQSTSHNGSISNI